MSAPLRVVTWNVNGLRACAAKGFARWLARSGADIVGVQEVRALPEELPRAVARPAGWHLALAPAVRRGYSGVGLYSRRKPDAVDRSLAEQFDVEGRLVVARFGRLVVANAYFPKGSGRDRDNSRVPYKLAFYRALFDRVEKLRRARFRVLVIGDFNTAHREIDLPRPRDNRKNSGFLPEERAEIDRWIAAGWTDVFRAFEPGPGHYTWWSQRSGPRPERSEAGNRARRGRSPRQRNVGWRIDSVLASPAAMKFARGAWLEPRTRGSDHCPAGVLLDGQILGA
jgi:exodeoxyribonuclease III